MAVIQFTNNYSDLSSNRGFQFRFQCQKCGNGYLSTFKPNTLGTAAAAASAVSTFLGGIFGRAAYGAQQLESIAAGPQKDAALRAAVEEVKPHFRQCSRCGHWVCVQVCWNERAGLCETCAPDREEASASAHANQVLGQPVAPADAQCAKCGAHTGAAKFCPECGTPTAPARHACAQCGANVEGNPKFCPECGKQQ